MKKLMIVALAVALVAPFAMGKTESFDSWASAQANGWTTSIDPAGHHTGYWWLNGGWANTNTAFGAAAGEAYIDGYHLNEFRYVADTSLDLPAGSALHAEGRITLDNLREPLPYGGWVGGTQMMVAAAFMDINGGTWPATQGAGGGFTPNWAGLGYWNDHFFLGNMQTTDNWGHLGTEVFVEGTFDFVIDYNPTTDTLTATLTDVFVPEVSFDLICENAGMQNLSYDAFGMANNSWYQDMRQTYIALDDLTYVPEPATMSLLGLGGLVAIRRRK